MKQPSMWSLGFVLQVRGVTGGESGAAVSDLHPPPISPKDRPN